MALNWVVDPFDAFRVLHIAGVNAIKPDIKNYSRLSKAVQIQWRQPKSIAIGSSRSVYGYDMQHPGWTQPAYNYALSGSHMHDVLRFFQHAVHEAPIQRVVLGLDFFMFNVYNETPLAEAAILSVNEEGALQPWYRIQQSLTLLTSVDTFSATLNTLKKQDETDRQYAEDGRYLPRTDKKVQSKPMYKQFLSTEKSYTLGVWTPCANGAFSFQRPHDRKNTLAYLKQIIDLAQNKNIQLYLVISPSHARLWEVLDHLGLWSKFEAWKQALVKITEPYNAETVQLWDFSGYHTYAVEAVPTTLGIPMMWYDDPSHYSVRLGRLLLDRIFNLKQHPFGLQLNPHNITAHLANIRNDRARYRRRLGTEAIKILQDTTLKQAQWRQSMGSVCATNTLANMKNE